MEGCINTPKLAMFLYKNSEYNGNKISLMQAKKMAEALAKTNFINMEK